MIDYNEKFLQWLKNAEEQGIHKWEDVPRSLQEEYYRLTLLADLPFRDTYGTSKDAARDLLHHVLGNEEFFDESGTPLQIIKLDPAPKFQSPVNGIVTCPLLYIEDERDRRFVFYHCDHRGPNVTRQAAAFDAIHEKYHKLGVEPDAFPEVYFIYLSDYDLSRKGEPFVNIDFPENSRLPSDQEWRDAGCDPNQPDPVMNKLHIILCDVNQFLFK